jgi:hypothetical protein
MKKTLVIIALVAGTFAARADSAVFQASLTPDIAIHSRTTEINGFAINIWGENPQHSFNLGLVNGSTGESAGFSLGLANYAESYTGVQFGFVNYSTGTIRGWQDGIVNISKGEFHGWMNGDVNISLGTFVGFQSGYVNVSTGDFKGFQLALVNYANNLHGLQIGAVNIAMNNGWFNEFPDKLAKGFPIVNWSF